MIDRGGRRTPGSLRIARIYLAVVGLALVVAGLTAATAAGFFRWTDADGNVHYGDSPVPGARPIAVDRVDASRLRYRVKSVPDGDTVHLVNGDRIRLLGINTPEVAHRNRPGEEGGEEAAAFLSERLLGARVALEWDVEARDKYRRRLAHVFDDQGHNINQLLVEEGLAFVALHPPNLKHSKDYLAAEARARAASRGLWALPRYQVQPMADAGKHRNTFQRLRGTLVSVDPKRKYTYLSFREGLTASIPNKYLEGFVDAGLDPEALVGRRMVVRGWVKRYRGKPALYLNHPSQVERVIEP